jgi:polysaccharide deacetylase family protein (PEP-CTERM system associated)
MNILGIDFEEWFHPQIIQNYLDNKKREPLIINGIDKILDLLRLHDTYATFFVVGELLEYKPDLLDKILNAGHEIGFHTMYHTRLDTADYKEKFKNEINQFAILTNKRSRGFRAPTFSLNNSSSWAIDVLYENDYLYDSSIMPVKTSMYGISDAETKPYKISSSSLAKHDPNGKLLEFPLLTTKILGKKIPSAGGFYLRALPMKITTNAIKNYEKLGIPATFYIHSWELTPEFMPRISMSFKDNFITFHNINHAFSRMGQLLKNFSFTSFDRYMEKISAI